MRVRLFMSLLLSLALLAVSPPGANASPADAMNRCRAGETGRTFPYRFDAWNVPTFMINPGDVYRVTYVGGTIKTGLWPWDPSYTPNGTGWSDVAPSGQGWLVPGLPKYGLVAGWKGLGGFFWLGANSLCIQWTGITPVEVMFEQNETMWSDNSGYWDMTVHLYPA